MKVAAVIPYRGDASHRTRASFWLRARYRLLLPDVEVFVVDADPRHQAPFNCAASTNRGLTLAVVWGADVVILNDADTVWNPESIHAALALIDADERTWCLPARYVSMSEAHTAEILGREPDTAVTPGDDAEWIGDRVSSAGLVVAPARAFDAAGGYDPRYTRWGEIDTQLHAVLDTLWAPVTRVDGDAFHCWHPVDLAETYGSPDHRRQRALTSLYVDAWGDPDAMRAVLTGRSGPGPCGEMLTDDRTCHRDAGHDGEHK